MAPIPERSPASRSSGQFIPQEVRAILSDSLTERGMEQWWRARLRYLDGHRPAEWWTTHRDQVLAAAHAFDEGVYV